MVPVNDDVPDAAEMTTGSELELGNSRKPLRFQVVKVSASLARQWRSADSKTIIGIAVPSANQDTGKRILNNLIVSDGGRLQTLQLGPEAAYSHTHLVQARKRQKLSPSSSDPYPTETAGFSSSPICHPTEFPIGEFSNSSSGIRVIGSLSSSRALTPSFDKAYRNTLKTRTELMAKPAHHHTKVTTSGYNRDKDGEQHLFKFYNPTAAEGAEFLPQEHIKQRPTVASRESKATAMSSDQIREYVFKVFEAKQDEGVMLKEFQAKLKVPQAQLRAALDEIGEYTSRNGQRPKWYLKKEFAMTQR